jgi:hypothetical protein
MTDKHTTDRLDQWRPESAGLSMQADATEAGKLVRLADVVLWLIVAKELPRKVAVEKLCDALEAASTPPALFLAQDGAYAMPADDAAFGYYTEARLTEAREVDAQQRRQEADPWQFNLPEERQGGYAAARPSEDWQPLTVVRHLGRRDLSKVVPVLPGVPAALRLMRNNWMWARRRAVSSDAEAFSHARLPGRAIAVRIADAARLWGWGAGASTVVASTDDEWTPARMARRHAELKARGVADPTKQVAREAGIGGKDPTGSVRHILRKYRAATKPSPLPSVNSVRPLKQA